LTTNKGKISPPKRTTTNTYACVLTLRTDSLAYFTVQQFCQVLFNFTLVYVMVSDLNQWRS